MSITAAIHAELIQWFATVPAWQSYAFRTLLGSQHLGESELSRVFEAAQIDLGLAEGRNRPSRLSEADLPTEAPTSSVLPKLQSIGDLVSVNMLSGGQRLTFGPNLTIIYGANGAGKSGYARVLKLACRCHEVAAEPILPDVYEFPTPGDVATAKFEVGLGDERKEIVWQEGAPAEPLLKNFIVFDSKAARAYLSERNAVVVMPSILAKLEELGAIIKAVKERLQAFAIASDPAPIILQRFVNPTPTGAFLASITAVTEKETLENALRWTPEDQTKLDDLTVQHAKLTAEGPLAIRKQIAQRRGRLNSLRSQLARAEELLSETRVQALASQYLRCGQLQKQKDEMAKLALTGTEIGGVGTGEWEQVIRAAAVFFTNEADAGGVEFPGTLGQSRCVLCQQILTPEAHTRLVKFWQFLQDDAARLLRIADEQLSRLTTPIRVWPDIGPLTLTAIRSNLEEEVPSIWRKVEPFFVAIEARRQAILRALAGADWSLIPLLPASLAPDCDAEELALRTREEALGDPARANLVIANMMTEITELVARQRAAAGRETLLDHHQRLVTAAKYRAASQAVTTLPLSTFSNFLQRKYVTKVFTTAVQENAKALGWRRELPSIASQTEFGKVTQSVAIAEACLDGVSPDRVFSEGEQTALALAYFLAEHGESQGTAGLIFDDPVTSLGHRIRSKVVEKVIGLAAQRQVIVFTHDLSFFCGLKEAAIRKKVPLQLRSLYTVGQKIGMIREGEPLDAMAVSDREKLLEAILKRAEQAEADADASALGEATARFYSILRSTWERAVEELLFNKVVTRFDDSVKTMSLTGAVIDAAIIEAVFSAMSKCSAQIDAHDHAVAANSAPNDIAEMKADFEALRLFRTEQRKRIRAQEAALAHLKV